MAAVSEGELLRRHDRLADAAVGGGFIVLAVGATGMAWSFPPEARFWPAFAIVVTLVGAVAAVARLLRGFSGTGANPADTAEAGVERLSNPRRAGAFIGVVIVFNVLLATLGFVTASVFALVAVPRLIDERRWPMIIGTGAAFLISAYLLFTKLVDKSVPPDWFSR